MPKRLLHLRPWRRHSIVLAVAGMVYVCYGIALWTIDPTRERTSGLTMATELLPFQAWGVVWASVGLMSLASTRWPPQSETWGYAAMEFLAVFWAACYFLGILLLDAPIVGINGGLVWTMVAFLWWAISGLANPDEDHRPVAFDWTIYGPEVRDD